ncbi:MAG TPA: ATP-binding cassette domain-containing protein [Verrucomicrobiae bacterium]|nr:ATP-binding cassette domain-containing protein [Verrucomicrobiae bacterium]
MISFNNAVFNLSSDGRRKLSGTFRLQQGDFAVLLGLNGAGKTTLLDAIAGIRRPVSGKIEVVSDGPIAYAVQDSASGLLPWKSVLANILFPSVVAGRNGSETTTKAERLLDDFQLNERRDDFPYRLSEGEKQIINVIRCVCTPASVVLLDEPFAALNSHARGKATALLTEFAKDRTTVLVTHDPVDCILPINRFLLISNSAVNEIDSTMAKGFLSNALSEA